MQRRSRRVAIITLLFASFIYAQDNSQEAAPGTQAIFPHVTQHVHGPTIVELSNGDLLTAWFQGSGERWADDVAIMGARRKSGSDRWSEPFVMADVPGFPDINPVLFVDGQSRLWLVWYTVMANQWETSLVKYRISNDYLRQEGGPEWAWQEVLHVKPGDPTERGMRSDDRFVQSVEAQVESYREYLLQTMPAETFDRMVKEKWEEWRDTVLAKAKGEDMVRKGRIGDGKGGYTEAELGYPYFRRMGWQTKNKPFVGQDKRIILPLYSDGFSFSLMALTDDGGRNWRFSTPLVGAGNIQPAIVQAKDGTLLAYMRDNGPPPKRLHLSRSVDNGVTWSPVRDSQVPNPGAGADLVTLDNGHWLLAFNDTTRGRYRLVVSRSTDEGQTWSKPRYLADDAKRSTSFAYPAIIQGRDGALHVVYSYHGKQSNGETHKTIKHVRFQEAWLSDTP